MPLLHKKQFIKKKQDPNLKPTDKVFFCDLTEEIFTDYDEFWERLVLLNALVWTCELTGRPSLTYQEALESENKAKRTISSVSFALKRPIILISTYTRRGKISDMSDDVFNYIRDRYFVGEEVEAIVSKHWYDCKVTKVIMASREEIALYERELADSDEETDEDFDVKDITPRPLTNGSAINVDDDDDDEIQILRDDHRMKPVNQKCNANDKKIKFNEDVDYPPFPTVKYEVVEIEPWNYKECKKHIVSWDQIRRNKSAFTRDKCKIFVKQCVRMNVEGYYTVKDAFIQKFGIKNMTYNDIFVGKPPKFEDTKMRKSVSISENEYTKEDKPKKTKDKEEKHREPKKKEKKKEIKEKLEETPKKNLEPKKNLDKIEDSKKKAKIFLTEEEREALRKQQMEERERVREKHKEEIRLRLERLRAARKKERDVQKEEKRLVALFKEHWFRKREDLECDNHKDMPSFTPIQCRIPNELFGDFITILEFVNGFSELLELKDVYPHGITFDMLEHALIEKEIAGVFNDIIQLFLGAIFSLQQEEDEEVEGDTAVDMASMDFESNLESKSLKTAVSLANKAATWSQQYQGVSLQKAPLDALTLTEILRLHLLASGASNVANAFWRHVNRGGYKPTDDPGLQFKLEEPEIVKKLTTESLFDLQIGEKLKVLNVLVAQILTYASIRDTIEDKYEKLRGTNNTLRLYRFAEIRKEKEEIVARKQKEKDEKLKQLKKKYDIAIKSDKPEVKEKEAKGEEEEEGTAETEEKKQAREEKEMKQRERRKQEAQKKEKEFLEKIQSLSRGFRQFPLGQDRAYRRYWLFNTLPGLFIEDWDPNLGCCQETPTAVAEAVYNPEDDKELLEKINIQAIKNLEETKKEKESDKTSSDKENDVGESPIKKGTKHPSGSTKKLLQAPNQNIMVGVEAAASGCATKSDFPCKDEDEDEEEEEADDEDFVYFPASATTCDGEKLKEFHSSIFGLCSSSETCPVHADTRSRPRWSFIHDTEKFSNLIDSLNPRGNRENDLKEVLVIQREKIETSLQNCPAYKLDPSVEPDVPTNQRKSERNAPSIASPSANLNFPPGTPTEKILQSTLRDMILEVEERLDNGMLGSLKVAERQVWRQALADGTSISFSSPQDLDWGGKKRIKQFKADIGLEVAEDNDILDTEDLISKDGLTQAGVLKELAIAILQVSQAVEPKYLKAPLAESNKMCRKRHKAENRLKNQFKKDKDKKEEQNNEDSSSDEEEESFEEKNIKTTVTDNALRTPIERWEKSLMACTSYSQIFLHLATLDNSITWSRSAVNTRCCLCRRKSDPENMLLCDDCDRGYHMYCLKPEIKVIPSGDWYCDKCKPKAKPKTPKKLRKIYKEESDEDDFEVEEVEEEAEEDAQPFVNHEYCDACEMGGEIICCDTCPRSFHLDCANIKKVPRGDWSCPLCKEEQAKKANSRNNSNQKKRSNESKREPKKRSTRKSSDEDYVVDEQDLDDDEWVGSAALRRRGIKRPIEEVDSDFYHKSAIESILSDLSSHEDSWPFSKPVYRQEVPDYYEKVKKPMDLRTIKVRFNKNKYSTDAEFIADVLLIFQNCQQYYGKEDEEYDAGTRLSKYFLRKIKSYKLANGTNGEEEDSLSRPSKRKR